MGTGQRKSGGHPEHLTWEERCGATESPRCTGGGLVLHRELVGEGGSRGVPSACSVLDLHRQKVCDPSIHVAATLRRTAETKTPPG